MAQDARGSIYDALAARGVSRRDFMKFCGATAAMLGMSELAAPQIAAAVEKAAGGKMAPVIWLDMGLCTGCTESMAQVDTPDIATIVLEILSINYMETIMAAAGTQAEEAKAATIEQYKGKYIAVVEGSVITAFDGNALRIAGKTGNEALKEVCSNAAAIVAVGSCAVDGGWVRGAPNPAGAKGVMDVKDEFGFGAVPIVNLPTCPVNPEWVVAVVIDVLMLDALNNLAVLDLDPQGRPKLMFGSTIHDNCPRRGHFENNEFVEVFGSDAERKQWCLYKVHRLRDCHRAELGRCRHALPHQARRHQQLQRRSRHGRHRSRRRRGSRTRRARCRIGGHRPDEGPCHREGESLGLEAQGRR
jgi:hydrogenase small subunit